jgi:UDP-N-acetylmuramoyl-tripeptide--D-alanyl-D-alanine ligase
VAVAGSVGKTSTTRAVAAALARSSAVRSSPKNFNNEIGVPLTILGAKASGGRSPLAWARILLAGAAVAYGRRRTYPRTLVLEMATDHPGDLAYLTALAPPDVAVVTAVAEEHTEFLGDLEGVAKEEGTVVRALGVSGTAVLNADDPRVAEMAKSCKGRVLTFGFSADADVRAEAVVSEVALGTRFTRFDLVTDGARHPVTLPEAVGTGNVYAALAAAGAALALGVDPALVPYGLAEYQPPPGRLRVLPGIKGTVIIDDTYNSSPRAASLALETLQGMHPAPGGRRVAALGDMLELGALTEEAHAAAGRTAAARGVELLVCVGPRSVATAREAVAAGMPDDRVFRFDDSRQAGRFLQERIRPGDVVLIKGSQGMRMERAVKEVMAEPERAAELLVRQSRDWA